MFTARLMDARRAIGLAKRTGDSTHVAAARIEVQAAKVALGERGPVWWTDGAPDQNRRMARNTQYAAWFAMFELLTSSDSGNTTAEAAIPSSQDL